MPFNCFTLPPRTAHAWLVALRYSDVRLDDDGTWRLIYHVNEENVMHAKRMYFQGYVDHKSPMCSVRIIH